MQTRRDLYQAYKLMTQRLGMALLQGEPDLPESPMRRHNVAMFGSVLVAVLVTAVFGVLGLLSPGNGTGLTDPGVVIIEEESGAIFIYSAPQGKMIPVDNMTSARLLLGESEVKVNSVTAASLAQFQRGVLVGIPGAPKSLPAHDNLVRTPWSACVLEAADTNGERKPYTTLIGGLDVGGGPIEPGAGILVEEGGQAWLLWSNQRMRVPAKSMRALSQEKPRQVPAAWLNALPVGPDFQSPSIQGLGRTVRGPDGRKSAVGMVFKVPSVTEGPPKWYVLLADGLADLTPAQAALLLEDPAIKQAYGRKQPLPADMAPAIANGMKESKTQLGVSGLPTTMPKIIPSPSASPLCAVYPDTERGSTQAVLTVGSTMRIPPPPKGWFNQDVVDQVVLPPGRGALVGLLPGNGRLDAVGPLFLIGDQGRRHSLPSSEALTSLGYTLAEVAPLPAHLVKLIPEGPTLDAAAASTPIQVSRPAPARSQG
ncbi:type VII secretion protein EccB [Streptosporangium amethystogenes subsp. fukuiense]|uniref:Type VII secretion protein EccB n=1 Tax=Streptosporangium amethystogenes subsp. fukuiense TaxID=698418 RepID=A0ABW2TCC2_9ACTN